MDICSVSGYHGLK